MGRVKSLLRNGTIKFERIIKIQKTTNGYEYCLLRKCNIYKMNLIHRLVAIEFLSNPENKPQVNHINGIKTDNMAENLEWVSRSENQIHAYKTGLQKLVIGEQRSKLKNEEVIEIKKMLADGINQSVIANNFNIGKSNISYIKSGKTWRHV